MGQMMRPRVSLRVILRWRCNPLSSRNSRFSKRTNCEGIDHLFCPPRSFRPAAHEKASMEVGSSLIAIITPLSDAALRIQGRNYFPPKYGRDAETEARVRESGGGEGEGVRNGELLAGLIPRFVPARSPSAAISSDSPLLYFLSSFFSSFCR